jgi:hypothetical protein
MVGVDLMADLEAGDLYEDAFYHPCLCFGVRGGIALGVSLISRPSRYKEQARMNCMTLKNARRYAAAVLLILAAAGCSSTPVDCGGKVRPQNLGADALRILEKARAASTSFCAEPASGCDFTVSKTANGWAVAATRRFAVNGKCGSGPGDDIIFAYDEAGTLVREIYGI